jgi:hypothetical protein
MCALSHLNWRSRCSCPAKGPESSFHHRASALGMTLSSLQVELFCLVKRQPSPATMWLYALQLLRSHSELFSRRPSTDEP